MTHADQLACPLGMSILTRAWKRAYHRHLTGPLEGIRAALQRKVLSPGRGGSCEKHSSNSSNN
jgi:hypothetical protein